MNGLSRGLLTTIIAIVGLVLVAYGVVTNKAIGLEGGFGLITAAGFSITYQPTPREDRGDERR